MDSQPPPFPGAEIRLLLAVVVDVIGLIVLWTLAISLWVKCVTTGALIVGLWTIVTFHLGRRYEWKGRRGR
jgi:hypothetical protein